MEKQLIDDVQFLHREALPAPEAQISSFFSCRVLILHPNSTHISLRVVFNCLIQFLERDNSPYFRHALKLLIDLVIRYPYLFPPPSVVSALLTHLISGKRFVAETLSALAFLVQSGEEASSIIRSTLKPDLVLSLARSRSLAVRSQLLRFLALESRCGDDLSLTTLRVFLGLTADIYPSLRSSALDGLRELCETEFPGMDFSMIQICYEVAVEQLHDDEVFVKMAAVRLVLAFLRLIYLEFISS